jgi:hypothetical protein
MVRRRGWGINFPKDPIIICTFNAFLYLLYQILNPPGKDPIYTFNAFFMSMKQKFIEEDASIHYYCVEWSEKEMAWSKFRGESTNNPI